MDDLLALVAPALAPLGALRVVAILVWLIRAAGATPYVAQPTIPPWRVD